MGSTIVLLAASTILLAGAACVVVLLRPDSLLDGAIALGVVASAAVALMIGLTGALGQLHPRAVFAADTAFLAAALAAAVSSRGARSRSAGCARRLLHQLQGAHHALRRDPWVGLVVAVAVAGLAWQALVALLLPPYAFDALTYHLTIVATWLQQEELAVTPLSLCCANYPANAELMFAWPALFAGADGFVDTVQLGFAALGALAVAGIARSAGLPRAAAAAAAGLFAATPVVLTQASTNYADVMIVAWALAALHSLVRFLATGRATHLVPAALATGLVLGTKGTGVVWAAALITAATVLLAVAMHRRRLSAWSAVAMTAAFIAACLAFGSYWYVRNWIETGNPLYPFEVQPAGIFLFEGPIQFENVIQAPGGDPDEPYLVSVIRSWAADLDFWRQGSYEYQQRRGGLGPLWPWLGLPLSLPLAIVLVRRRSPAALAVLVIALVFILQPFRWWSRFTIQLAALGAVAIVAAAVWAPRRWMRRTVRVAALTLTVAGVVLSSYEVDPAARARALPAGDLLWLIGQPDERTLGKLFFPEYRFLEDMPEDATVIVDLEAKPVRFVYPFFGASHGRRVLPAGEGVPPAGAWVITGAGRPLDRRLVERDDFKLVSDVRGLRAWRPRP